MTHSGTDEQFPPENNDEDPLCKILRLNDVIALKDYMEKYPKLFLALSKMDEYSPFFYATNDKCIDVLRVILDFYDNLEIRIVDRDGSSLLDLACIDAQLETVRFLLDRDPPLGARYAWDSHGGQALLFAAESLAFDGSVGLVKITGTQEMCLRNQIARSEAVISMLLDRGASVQKAVIRRRYTDIEEDEEDMPIMATVLGYAISRCGYELISRLIAQGANVHAWQWTWVFDMNPEVDVTALHIGCKYWNVEGVKALLDNHGNETDLAQMVFVRDTAGRTPLHWVAEGPGWLEEDLYSEEEITSRNRDIFGLLIASNPETLNARGEDGATPLFSIIRGHVACGSSTHFGMMIQLFCDKGADAGIRDRKGQNVLHVLAQLSAGVEPINPNILDTLVAHGAKVNDPDLEGNTPLHVMARNLRQPHLVKILIRHGANINAVNVEGETPLHKAMAAFFPDRHNRDGRLDINTFEERIEAHDEMLEILQEAGGSMDQPNAAGKTPRQLLEETRERWRKDEEARRIRDIPGQR